YLSVSDDEVFFAYADFEGLEEFDDGEDSSGDGNMEDFDEPLLAAPMAGIFLLAFGAGFTLASGGLSGLFGAQEESDLESRAEQVLVVNEVTVVAGDLDTDEIDGRLTSEQESDLFAVQYEVGEEVDGYTFYAPPEDAEAPVFAVGESELLAAQEQSDIESVVDAIDGDGRAAEEFDEFEWLLETAGEGLIAFGGYGSDGFEGPEGDTEGSGDGGGGETPDPEESLGSVGDANGLVSTLSFTESAVDAVLAASFDDLNDDQQSEIENDFESDRTDVSLTFDGGRLTAEATYEEEVLEEAGTGTTS
ncbi:MAG: hypothetical protein ACOCZD_02165, partial [Haloferacaceae archaeon]